MGDDRLTVRSGQSTGSDTPLEAVPVVSCAGIPVAATGRRAAAELIIDLARGPKPSGMDIHLCNAYTIALSDRDRDLRAVFRRASVNFPDGKAVVWAYRLQHRGRGLPSDRVYGPDLFLDVVRRGAEVGLRHYLLGSTPDVLLLLEGRLRRLAADVDIVGSESPPFRSLSDDELREQAKRISASGADVVWVGLGTPKQDWEVARLAAAVPAVHVAVGAAFDFLAGTKPQAPRWMRDNGLEWVFRLGTEPRRLWRRYLFGNARFLWAVYRRRPK